MITVRPLLDILTDEKTLVEERDLIYDLILRAADLEEDEFMRDKLDDKNNRLKQVRAELREYLITTLLK